MIERLLENWLDSASERSYQGPFLQMLVAAGYSLVHNTRHTPIEFGKDIIARAPDGQVVAFQLKGNPKKTMNLGELRPLYPQLIELSTFAINYPGVESVVPKPFLVLNGEFGEDAQKGLSELNAGTLKANPVSVWSRGHMLEMAKNLSGTLWPAEIPDISALLKILIVDPHAPFPLKDVEWLCKLMLGLGSRKMDESSQEMQRRIASAGLLVGICVSRQVEAKNHWAAFQAWAMLSGLIAACADRYFLDIKGPVKATFDLSLDLVDQSLDELASELIEVPHFTRPSISDGIVYNARITICTGLMGVYWHRSNAKQDDAGKSQAIAALRKLRMSRELWGEAAIPGELLRIWVMDHVEVGLGAEAFRLQLLGALLNHNRNNSRDPWPPPYYGFEETVREKMLSRGKAAFEGEKHDGLCYMALPLFEELVRQNLKHQAKAAWPEMTKLLHLQADVSEGWEFPLSRAGSARNLTVTLPKTAQWSEVVDAAYVDDPPLLPRLLADRPDVIALIVLLYPQRATPAVVRILSKKLGKPWLS